MKLSDNLKRIRKDNNLSQEQLAEKLGVSRQAVSKWESGQSYPEMDKVLLICKLFNYNLDELMNENVKEVDETKQSKININKYIDDFFAFITKTVDVFTSMRFRDRIKCLIEILFISMLLIVVYFIVSAIGGSVFANTFGILPNSIYSFIRNILESICTIFYLIVSVTVLLHIFKIRYLDYYEIVKENSIEEKQTENNENRVEEQEKYDEKRKIFIEKKKEKIIIRDPNHSQSRFLNGLFRIILAIIKFMAICVAAFFVFSFVGLVCLLILSFMFAKTGLVFWGSLFAIISALIVNYIILELFYNFIISKKSKKTRIAILFLISLIIMGIGSGFVIIGIKDFNIINKIPAEDIVEDIFEFDMTENLSIDSKRYSWYSNIEYIETDFDKVKVEVTHAKYQKCYYDLDSVNNTINIYSMQENSVIMETIREVIEGINNKEIKNYDYIGEIKVYTSKENIDKLKQNQITKYELSKEIELDELYEENEKLENKIFELEDEIVEKENKIEDLQLEIEDLKTEIESNNSQIEVVE